MTASVPTRPIAERVLGSFPSGSYALHALLQVLEVVESEGVETAATECRIQPRMLINPRFVAKHAETSEKLLMLVMHELHHVLLGHTRLFPRLTRVDNLVFDAVINALLCRMLPAPEHTKFFTDYYDDRSFPACLLRPPARWSPGDEAPGCPPALEAPSMGRARRVYRQLYSELGASYHDLYDVLRRHVSEEQARAVPLLGGHGGEQGQPIEEVDLREGSPVLFGAVRRIVEDWPQPPDPIAGRSIEELTRVERLSPATSASNRQLLRSLLRKVAGLDGHSSSRRAWREDTRAVETPIPGFQRRSLVLRAMGAQPLLHQASSPVRRWLPAGERVHVYLDVSGSIGGLKGALCGAVLDCAAFVHPQAHLFSTVVADVSLDGLRRGDCPTTDGTNISCVATHMKANRVRRAVIITDGFVGALAGEHRSTLHDAVVGVALTPGPTTRNDLLSVTNHWTQLRPSSDRTDRP
jgi:hypothetical protein